MEDRESSLADDLRAARALIDTPEKRADVGGFAGLLRHLQLSQYLRIKAHICNMLGYAYQDQALMLIDDMDQPSLNAMFDRAIAVATGAA
jgi:hypothetical protein